jgi:hypothetical protein
MDIKQPNDQANEQALKDQIQREDVAAPKSNPEIPVAV